jgi:mono/diheme cytochrome c family protein
MTSVLAALLGPLFSVASAFPAEQDETNRGKALVIANCSRCHAVGKEGDSPHPEAPAFRTLASRHPIDSLQEALAEGIVFSPQDALGDSLARPS